MAAVHRNSRAWGVRVSNVLFVGRLSYCFEKSQAVGGGGLGRFMLCQVWEVLLQVSPWLAVDAWILSRICILRGRVAKMMLSAGPSGGRVEADGMYKGATLPWGGWSWQEELLSRARSSGGVRARPIWGFRADGLDRRRWTTARTTRPNTTCRRTQRTGPNSPTVTCASWRRAHQRRRRLLGQRRSPCACSPWHETATMSAAIGAVYGRLLSKVDGL